MNTFALLTVLQFSLVMMTLFAQRLLQTLPADNSLRRYIKPPLSVNHIKWHNALLIILGIALLASHYA